MNPRLLNPRLLNPRLLNPRLLNPRLLAPRLLAPRLLAPRLLAPRLLAPSLLTVIACVDAAHGALIYLTGRDKPLAGYVDQSDPQAIIVREALPGGQSRELRVPREQVQEIVATVDPQRLAALTPDAPAAYRDYAEELAEIAAKQGDPEARDTSLRLFLIAAYLDRSRLARSCLLGMAEIAATPAEARRYRAMAYLLDPQHSRNPLDMDRPADQGKETQLDQADQTVLKALQALRRDDAPRARVIAEQPGFADAIAKWSKFLTYEEVIRAAKDQLSPPLLRKLLQVELAIQESVRPPDPAEASAAAAWSETIREHGTRPGFPLALETITPWDPADCVYRDGRWTKPR